MKTILSMLLVLAVGCGTSTLSTTDIASSASASDMPAPVGFASLCQHDSDCATGLICSNDFTGVGEGFCTTYCQVTSDCYTGASCEHITGGVVQPGNETAFCVK